MAQQQSRHLALNRLHVQPARRRSQAAPQSICGQTRPAAKGEHHEQNLADPRSSSTLDIYRLDRDSLVVSDVERVCFTPAAPVPCQSCESKRPEAAQSIPSRDEFQTDSPDHSNHCVLPAKLEQGRLQDADQESLEPRLDRQADRDPGQDQHTQADSLSVHLDRPRHAQGQPGVRPAEEVREATGQVISIAIVVSATNVQCLVLG